MGGPHDVMQINTGICFVRTQFCTYAFMNKRNMALDALLDNTNKSSKHIVIYDKQLLQITPQITLML